MPPLPTVARRGALSDARRFRGLGKANWEQEGAEEGGGGKGSDGRANTEPGRRGLVREAIRQLFAQGYVDPIFYKLYVRPAGVGDECRPREKLLTLVIRFSFSGFHVKTVFWRSCHEVAHDGYLPNERRMRLAAVSVPS